MGANEATGVRVRMGCGWIMLAVLTISTIGDEISLITLIFRAADSETRFAVPMLLVAQLLPGLVAAPFVGRLIDTRDAGRILVVTALVQAGLLVWIATNSELAPTLLGASLLSVCFAISGAATFALIPVLAAALGIPLNRANSALELVRGAGMLAGPVAGGVLITSIGAGNALLIDAASFLLLALVLLAGGLRRPVEMAVDEPRTLLAEYWPILRNRPISVMTASLALEVFASAIADVAFVFLITVTLAQGSLAFGLVTGSWAGGMILGAAAAGARPISRPAPIAFVAATATGTTMLAIGAAGLLDVASVLVVGVVFVLGGIANSVHNVAVRTMLQQEAPPGQHGKVAAIYSAVTSGAVILGYVTGGLFTPNNAVGAYLVAGLIGISAGLVGWRLFRVFGR
ncbi:MFS transporter [Allosphingosinicella deserti]|uniref:MFS transporter n=1 Tax=Allosphingosinicella deserti TaxID=2116704 RepID=A0A2P7R097_9SPHN|nr:MFS transporter [Sphingomonas deserti]PSJ43637.1 MFS transporter [Sphingomonas deserti]